MVRLDRSRPHPAERPRVLDIRRLPALLTRSFRRSTAKPDPSATPTPMGLQQAAGYVRNGCRSQPPPRMPNSNGSSPPAKGVERPTCRRAFCSSAEQWARFATMALPRPVASAISLDRNVIPGRKRARMATSGPLRLPDCTVVGCVERSKIVVKRVIRDPLGPQIVRSDWAEQTAGVSNDEPVDVQLDLNLRAPRRRAVIAMHQRIDDRLAQRVERVHTSGTGSAPVAGAVRGATSVSLFRSVTPIAGDATAFM